MILDFLREDGESMVQQLAAARPIVLKSHFLIPEVDKEPLGN
jgi:hypothetical protein